MILLVALALAVVVGLARGGKLHQLGNLPLRQGGWALAALLLQSCLIYGPWLDRPSTRGLGIGLMFLSYLLLLVFVWLNRRLSSIGIIGLGLFLNLLVIVVNGGFMPTSPETLQRAGYATPAPQIPLGTRLAKSKDIILARQDTKLGVLSDIFVIPPPFPLPTVFSVGDLVIAIGVLVLVQSAMLKPN